MKRWGYNMGYVIKGWNGLYGCEAFTIDSDHCRNKEDIKELMKYYEDKGYKVWLEKGVL